ncbi:ATP-binding cassette domain-containing protein, partial [Rhizobiaceae sp. 2RAB30]
LGIGRTFQVARIFKELTTLENLVVALEAKRRQDASIFELVRLAPAANIQARAREMLNEFSLERVADWTAGSLSHGDKKCLELAMVIAARPRLLMLDEPTAGMAPADRQRSVDMIARLLKKGGLSLLLTEHDMEVVFGLATRITVLNYGEIIATGSPQEVRSSPRVREVYLGHDVSAA